MNLIRRTNAEEPFGGFKLTARESEVLSHLARGLDHQEIAETLLISPKTVETHIQHVLSKLGVKNRAQAVALVFQGEEGHIPSV